MRGKTIAVFSPVSKGWGTATTALALGARLEQAGCGKILLIDLYEGVSALEEYMIRDLKKDKDRLPVGIFLEDLDERQLVLLSRKVSEGLYFLKADISGSAMDERMRGSIMKLIESGRSIFDVVILRLDGKTAALVSSGWDIGISVIAHDNGLDKQLNGSASLSWYAKLQSAANHICVINGVTGSWSIREAFGSYGEFQERTIRLPFNKELASNGNMAHKLYSAFVEELGAEKTPYSRKVGELADRAMKMAGRPEAGQG